MTNTNSARAGTLTTDEQTRFCDLLTECEIEYRHDFDSSDLKCAEEALLGFVIDLLKARDGEIERLRAENNALRHMAYEGRPCVTLTDAARLAMEEGS